MNVKNVDQLNILFQEYNDIKKNILKEIYQIMVYSKSCISRNELFLMSQEEKNILIELVKEKQEDENKQNSKIEQG